MATNMSDVPADPSAMGWNHPHIPFAIGISLGSGLATAVGGSLVFFPELMKRVPQATLLAISLALSAGVMIYVSFIEIFAKSYDAISSSPGISESGAAAITTVCFFAGMFFCVLLEIAVHKLSSIDGVDHGATCAAQTELFHHEHDHMHQAEENGCAAECEENGCANVTTAQASGSGGEPLEANGQVHINIVSDSSTGTKAENGKEQPKALSTAASTSEAAPTLGDPLEKQSLKRMGLMTACAIAIHNFPEGLATFLATVSSPQLGASLGVAIAVHNIPEGLCVAMPIYYATGSKWKGFMWSVLSGLTEPIGGILGFAALQPVFTDVSIARVHCTHPLTRST